MTTIPTCGCTEELGPCFYHAEVLVQREGSSLRTADELSLLFVQDCVDSGVVKLNAEQTTAYERLGEVLEECRDKVSDIAWFENEDDTAWAYQLRFEVENALPDDVDVRWEDGYVLYRMAEDCPLLTSSEVNADDPLRLALERIVGIAGILDDEDAENDDVRNAFLDVYDVAQIALKAAAK